jgi:hypothetical protein
MKCKCENCEREFQLNRMWQKFCSKQCQQKWNHAQYRAARVTGELIAKGDKPLVELARNGLKHDEAYQAKWKAIRAEWDEEDRQEAQERPRFVRRF